MFGVARLLGLGLAVVGLGVGGTSGTPVGKLAVYANHAKWADGSPVESGGLNYPSDIYVVDLKSRHVRNVTHDERTEYSGSWLPDGRHILFASVPSDRMKPGPSHIFVVDVNGQNRRQLTSGAGEVEPELAPEGRRFLFFGQGAHQRGLYVMRVDGTHEKRLTHSREEPNDTSHDAWSPDGRRIVFARDFSQDGTRSDIFTIRADGTGLDRLTATKAEESAPAWSPDGEKIAFLRKLGDSYLVFVMRSDGTSVKELMRTGNAYSALWSSNDRVVYYDSSTDRWWSIDAEGKEPRQPLRPRTRVGDRLWDRRGIDLGSLSPDRTWIAFEAHPHGEPAIWVARADGTHRRLVTRRICCGPIGVDWGPR